MTRPGRQMLRAIWLAMLVLGTLWCFKGQGSSTGLDLSLFDDEAAVQPFNSRIVSTDIAKRVSKSKLSFDEWATRGRRLIEYMEESDPQKLCQNMLRDGVLSDAQKAQCTTQSVFTRYEELATNGWEKNPPGYWHPDSVTLNAQVLVQDAFQSLGISTSIRTAQNPGGSNEGVSWEQTSVVFNGKEVCEATEAIYKVIYNTKDGVMVGVYMDSPTEKRKEMYTSDWKLDPELAIPDLHLASDVVSLEYAEQCRRNGDRPQSFRYYFSDQINNDDTLSIINVVLTNKGYPATPVDGFGNIVARPWSQAAIFDRYNNADTQSFEALVGSPLGRKIAWMLIQHADLFGAKHIRKISVWRSDAKDARGRLKSLLFEIADVRRR
ncbi:unnamed protein product [Cercospora beticola]|nr:unnamed protein product [Cercospora beticola]